MCNKNIDIDEYEKEPEFIVDNFIVEKFILNYKIYFLKLFNLF